MKEKKDTPLKMAVALALLSNSAWYTNVARNVSNPSDVLDRVASQSLIDAQTIVDKWGER